LSLRCFAASSGHLSLTVWSAALSGATFFCRRQNCRPSKCRHANCRPSKCRHPNYRILH
jgi:hypothetical protein